MRTAVIILAAGQSRRFGAVDKLVAPVGGVPLVRRVAEAACASRGEPVVIVHKPGHRDLLDLVEELPLICVEQPVAGAGMSASIIAGLKSLRKDCGGAAIVPADLPMMSAYVIDRLICEFVGGDCLRIIVPVTEEGSQRNPVIWPRSSFKALMDLAGDRGGKALLQRFEGMVTRVPFDDASAFADVDTPEALRALEAQARLR